MILDEGGETASLLWTLCAGDEFVHFGEPLFLGGGEFRHLSGMLRRSAIGVDLADLLGEVAALPEELGEGELGFRQAALAVAIVAPALLVASDDQADLGGVADWGGGVGLVEIGAGLCEAIDVGGGNVGRGLREKAQVGGAEVIGEESPRRSRRGKEGAIWRRRGAEEGRQRKI